jgi:hypothetical protein
MVMLLYYVWSYIYVVHFGMHLYLYFKIFYTKNLVILLQRTEKWIQNLINEEEIVIMQATVYLFHDFVWLSVT